MVEPPKSEQALFLALLEGAGAVVVLNAAHQQGAHLHLGDGAEMLRLQDGILPGYFG